MTPQLSAVQHVRKMRGGAQSHLMRASDENFYVVKFQNNPQHLRVLANEMFASGLGQQLGLPVPEVAVIDVSDWLIEHTPELRIECAGHSVRCSSGLQLGTRYVTDPILGQVFDYLPEKMVSRISNVRDFARVLVLDKWAGNCDGRQAVFFRNAGARKYQVSFIDHGYCFNCHEWNFPDLALHGTYYRNYVYCQVTGWEAFEPVLSRAERMTWFDLWHCADGIPRAWYENDMQGLRRLVETLYQRRSKIRKLIEDFRHSVRNPFPNWKLDSNPLPAGTTATLEAPPQPLLATCEA
jgi:hypothetical protein